MGIPVKIRFCLVVILAAIVAPWAESADAQTPPESLLVVAREVVTLSGAEDNMRNMMQTLAPAMEADIIARGAPRALAVRFSELFIEEFESEVPQVLELAAVAYAGAFTEQQLIDLRDFYRTPTGQALRERTPELTQAMTRAGMIIGQQAGQRVLARLQAEQGSSPQAP